MEEKNLEEKLKIWTARLTHKTGSAHVCQFTLSAKKAHEKAQGCAKRLIKPPFSLSLGVHVRHDEVSVKNKLP